MNDKEKRIQCKRCKSYIPEHYNFCTFCGLRLKESRVYTEQTVSLRTFRKKYVISFYLRYKWKISLTPSILNRFAIFIYNFEKLCDIYNGFLEKFTHLEGVLVIFGHDEFEKDMAKKIIDFSFDVEDLIEKYLGNILEYGIGICAGWAYFGEIEVNNPMSITALGDCVNTSARLGELFQNKKYVCADIFEATVSYFDFEHLGKIGLKGKLEKIDVYTIISRKKEIVKKEFKSFYIERPDVEDKINKIISEWEKSNSRTIFISGEAGIGKTFLAEEIIDKLEKKNIIILSLKGKENFENEPLYPFKEFIVNSLNDKKFHFIKNYMQTFLTMIESKETEIKDKIIFDRLKYILLDIFKIIIEKKERVCIYFDDVDRADETTQNIINFLNKKLNENILFLMTGRIFPLNLDIENLYHIVLRPFEFIETKKFLEKYFKDVKSETALEIHNKTAGIPLYISQYIKSLLIKGQDIREVHELPLSFVSFVLSPIQKLKDEERSFLEILSVIGELDLESPLVKMVEKEIEKYLPDLIAKDIVRLERNKVFFVSPLVREVIYESLPSKIRENLYRDIIDTVYGTEWARKNPYFVFINSLKVKRYDIAWEYGIKTLNNLMKEGVGVIPNFIFEKLEEVMKNYEIKPMYMGEYFYLRGRYNFLSKNFEKAIHDFHKALLLTDESDKKWNEINLYLAKAYIERGNLSSSRKFLDDIKIQDEITAAKVYTVWAELHEKRGELFDALIFMRKANKELSKRGTSLSELKLKLSDLLFWTGNLEDAFHSVTEAEKSAFMEMDFENIIETQKIKIFLGFLFNDEKIFEESYNTGLSFSEKFENRVYSFYFKNFMKILKEGQGVNIEPDINKDNLLREPYIFYSLNFNKEAFVKENLDKDILDNPNIPIFQKLYFKTIISISKSDNLSKDIKKVMEEIFKYPIPIVHIFILSELLRYFKKIERFDIVKFLLRNYIYIYEDLGIRIKKEEWKKGFLNNTFFNPEKILEKV